MLGYDCVNPLILKVVGRPLFSLHLQAISLLRYIWFSLPRQRAVGNLRGGNMSMVCIDVHGIMASACHVYGHFLWSVTCDAGRN